MYAWRCRSSPIPTSCFRAHSNSNSKDDSFLFVLWCLGLFFPLKSHFSFSFFLVLWLLLSTSVPGKGSWDKYTFLCRLYCSIIPRINAGISSFRCLTEHLSPTDRHTWKPNLMRYDFYHFSYFYVSKVIQFVIKGLFISWKAIFSNSSHDTTAALAQQAQPNSFILEHCRPQMRKCFTHSAHIPVLPFCKWTLFDSSAHCISSPPSCSFFCPSSSSFSTLVLPFQGLQTLLQWQSCCGNG